METETTHTKNVAMLGRMVARADQIREQCNVPKDQLIIFLPFNVLPKTMAIHGYMVGHSRFGPAVTWFGESSE